MEWDKGGYGWSYPSTEFFLQRQYVLLYAIFWCKTAFEQCMIAKIFTKQFDKLGKTDLDFVYFLLTLLFPIFSNIYQIILQISYS